MRRRSRPLNRGFGIMAKEKKEKDEQPKAEKAEKKAKKPAGGEKAAAAPAAEAAPKVKGPTPRLRERYRNEILPALMKESGYKNPMAVPKLKKIVVNMGLGEASKNVKIIDLAQDELGRITG